MAPRSNELFPPSPRVIYSKAPLVQVICQLRFPTLLSIESQPPVEFQERIRDHFPLLEKVTNPLQTQLPPEVFQALGPDHDAEYDEVVEIDLSQLEPLLATPH